MKDENAFDVLIVGGSYAGLSAGMVLGRALRRVLIIDSGSPCNRQTPHSHNFLTQDGKTPAEISALAKQQVLQYESISFHEGLAAHGVKTDKGFEISTQAGDVFSGKKLLFATGIKDLLPDIPGVSECWGISLIHCPYCHGYEVRNAKTGILGNGEYGFDFSRLILNWTKDLNLYTNGKSTLTEEQTASVRSRNIAIVESEVEALEHRAGRIQNVVFKDGSKAAVEALYTRALFVQHCAIPEALGCELTDLGYIRVDGTQKTTIPGVYACGDNTTPMRSVSTAVAQGTMAGAMANRDLVQEEF